MGVFVDHSGILRVYSKVSVAEPNSVLVSITAETGKPGFCRILATQQVRERLKQESQQGRSVIELQPQITI